MKKIALVLVIFLIGMSASAYAESNCCNWAESKNWAVSAPGKLTRGVINLGLGWTNMFVEPFQTDSVMEGIGKGISDFLIRTFQGAGEIILFWLPPPPEETLHECVFYDWGLIDRGDPPLAPELQQ